MHRYTIAALTTVALLCVPPGARGGPAEDCLDAPTVACVTTNFSDSADLPLRAVRLEDRGTPIAWLLRALLALDKLDEAERVARREEREPHGLDRAADIAAARFVASVRAGTPDFDLLDRLGEADSPLAPLVNERHREDVAWNAHWRASLALLERLATDTGVPEARDAPVDRRAALRASPAWRGVAEGFARWNELRPPNRRGLGWTWLARYQLDLGDAAAAREALERIGPEPAEPDEVELWWRLGDRARADARARAPARPIVIRRHLERVAREALARGDRAGALAALDEAWAKGVVRDERGHALDLRHLRRVVRLTAETGDQTMALARAEAIRDLPASGTLVPESHWVDAAAALNDIGAHDEAARVLRDLLALRPADLAAAGLGGASQAPRGVERPGHSPRVRAAAELFRAGLRDSAEGLMRAALPRDRIPLPRATRREDVEALFALGGLRIPPRLAERVARDESLSGRAGWRFEHSSDLAIEWSEVLANDADRPDRVSALLALVSGAPVEARAYILLRAAGGHAGHNRADAAAAWLSEAIALLGPLDRPYSGLCRAMAQAARLGRHDLADTAFRAAVAVARSEPEAVRPAILVDVAACRAVPRY